MPMEHTASSFCQLFQSSLSQMASTLLEALVSGNSWKDDQIKEKVDSIGRCALSSLEMCFFIKGKSGVENFVSQHCAFDPNVNYSWHSVLLAFYDMNMPVSQPLLWFLKIKLKLLSYVSSIPNGSLKSVAIILKPFSTFAFNLPKPN